MNKTVVILIVIISALIICITFIFAYFWIYTPTVGEGGYGDNHGMMDMDQEFIENMIPHHQDAVDISNMALSKAEHQEIKQLAKNISINQSREIDEMRKWYKMWYGTDVPSNSHMMMNSTDLNRLENAKPFDKEFIEQMIPHHQRAIMMAQMVLNHPNRPEIRGLAESIIKSQSAEIEEMRTWYKEWYGTDVPTYS
ncbi:DUF305 domain-containing protein [Methanobacterium sp.]|uniref:DUF305 domain-containing protein n=1 Tax=Methanobacterium sp. TaxID=2164 RepID=UPI003C7419B1